MTESEHMGCDAAHPKIFATGGSGGQGGGGGDSGWEDHPINIGPTPSLRDPGW